MLLAKKNIFYNVLNKKSKKPMLVFLHGLGANWTTWKEVITYFDKLGYPILYQDLRGHGRSKMLESYELEDFAEDLDEILKKEKVNRKIVLIGHSLGGMIALVFYKKFKNRFGKMILVNTTYRNPVPFWYRYVVVYVDRVFSYISYLIGIPSSHARDVDFFKLRKMSNFRIMLKTMFYRRYELQMKIIGVLMDFNELNTLKKINIPTLILGSKRDELFSVGVTKRMHKYIKTSKLKILKGTHAIPIKKAKTVAEEIEDFVR